MGFYEGLDPVDYLAKTMGEKCKLDNCIVCYPEKKAGNISGAMHCATKICPTCWAQEPVDVVGMPPENAELLNMKFDYSTPPPVNFKAQPKPIEETNIEIIKVNKSINDLYAAISNLNHYKKLLKKLDKEKELKKIPKKDKFRL